MVMLKLELRLIHWSFVWASSHLRPNIWRANSSGAIQEVWGEIVAIKWLNIKEQLSQRKIFKDC